MTSENIRNYCEEALIITEEQGVHEALAFLIGEKFSLVYYQLKTAHNKIKYLYPGKNQATQQNNILKANKSLQLSYTLTINENYRDILEQIDLLEEIVDRFTKEIKESFSVESIQGYLNSFPRLAFKKDLPSDQKTSFDQSSPMTVGDIFSEVEDILIIDEIKSLFKTVQ